MTDAEAMRRALRLAARGWGRTAPNPMVGAVVVAAGEVVGEGHHARAGGPHAEIVALAAAGERARGAELFVTLEPCAHQGRTPPCAPAVAAAGVRRVVAAMQDPFPRVAGRGFALLRAAGVAVTAGVLEAEARELNRAYLKAVRTGLPWVTLKLAATLDGRIATRTGESRWVTGEAARRHVHRLRNRHDAVLVGSGTALADDPELTVRLPGGRNPLRVVADRRARLPAAARLAQTARAVPTLLLTAAGADTAALEALGVEVERLPAGPGGLDLRAGLATLAARGVHSVLCEGGAALAGSLLDAGLVDEVAWFLAPKLLGGPAPAAVGGEGVARMADARELRRLRVRRFGADLALFGYLTDPE